MTFDSVSSEASGTMDSLEVRCRFVVKRTAACCGCAISAQPGSRCSYLGLDNTMNQWRSDQRWFSVLFWSLGIGLPVVQVLSTAHQKFTRGLLPLDCCPKLQITQPGLLNFMLKEWKSSYDPLSYNLRTSNQFEAQERKSQLTSCHPFRSINDWTTETKRSILPQSTYWISTNAQIPSKHPRSRKRKIWETVSLERSW